MHVNNTDDDPGFGGACSEIAPPPPHTHTHTHTTFSLIPLGSLVQQEDTMVFVPTVVPRQFLCVKTDGVIGRD